MRAALWVAVAGCGFAPQATVDGAIGDGSSTAIDAAIDGPTCRAVPKGPFTLGTGQLGNPLADAVTQQPDLACMPNELVVGVQFDITTANPPGGWNQHVVMATHAQCGTIALGADGRMHTTATQQLTSITPQCNGWPVVTMTLPAPCPDGDALVAMSGNEATKSSTHSLFNSISIACAPLDVTGNTDQSQSALCPAGTAVTAFNIYSACGDDGLELQCTPTACM